MEKYIATTSQMLVTLDYNTVLQKNKKKHPVSYTICQVSCIKEVWIFLCVEVAKSSECYHHQHTIILFAET